MNAGSLKGRSCPFFSFSPLITGLLSLAVLCLSGTVNAQSLTPPPVRLPYPLNQAEGGLENIYSKEYLVVVVNRPQWIGRTVSIIGNNKVLAQGRMVGTPGYFIVGPLLGLGWDTERDYEFYIDANGQRSLLTRARLKSGNRGFAASSSFLPHFQNAVRLVNSVMATVPLTAYRYKRWANKGSDQASGSPGEELEGLPIGEGTAFMLSEEGLLVTCAHVVRGADEYRLFYNGRMYEAENAVSEAEARKWAAQDIAFLKIKADSRGPRNVPTKFATVTLASDASMKELRGETQTEVQPMAQALGFPSIERTTLRTLSIRATSFGQIENSFDSSGSSVPKGRGFSYSTVGIQGEWDSVKDPTETRGMSGGPLVTFDGRVVGMLHSTSPQFVSTEAIGAALRELNLSDRLKAHSILGGENWQQAIEQDPAWSDVLQAYEFIAVGKVREAADRLGAVLSSGGSSAQQAASLAFERIGPSGGIAITGLIEKAVRGDLKSLNPRILAQLINTAAKYRALPRHIIIKTLDPNNHQAVIRAGLMALRDLGDISFLTPQEFSRSLSLFNEDWWLAPEALYTLGRLSNEKRTEGVTERSQTRSADIEWRKEATALVRGYLMPRSYAGVMQENDPRIRRAAAEVVKQTDDTESRAGLIQILQADKKRWRRERAAETLGWIGGRDVIAALKGVVLNPVVQPFDSPPSDFDQDVLTLRYSVVEALGEIANEDSVAALQEILNQKSLNIGLRENAAMAIRQSGSKEAVSILRALVDEPNQESVLQARALEELINLREAEAELALVDAIQKHGISCNVLERAVYPAITRLDDLPRLRAVLQAKACSPDQNPSTRGASSVVEAQFLEEVQGLRRGLNSRVKDEYDKGVLLLKGLRFHALSNTTNRASLALEFLKDLCMEGDDAVVRAIIVEAPGGDWLRFTNRDKLQESTRIKLREWLWNK